MSIYFNRTVQPFCAATGFDHRMVTAPECTGCHLLNPKFRVVTPVPAHAEIIAIGDESPVAIKAPDRISRQKATHVAALPGLTLGQADAERQRGGQREADRKPRSGVQPPGNHTLHFSVGLGRFTWDPYLHDDGSWATCQNHHEWRVDVPNTLLSFDGFLGSLRQGLDKLSKRDVVKDWIAPPGNGQWTVSHSNPTKPAPQEVVEWAGTPLLSDFVNVSVYNTKPSPGTSKVYSLWLCWTPVLPPPETPPPSRTAKKPKAQVKKERVKKEPRVAKLEPVSSRKRARSNSDESTNWENPGAVTRKRFKALEAQLLGAIDDGEVAVEGTDGEAGENGQTGEIEGGSE